MLNRGNGLSLNEGVSIAVAKAARGGGYRCHAFTPACRYAVPAAVVKLAARPVRSEAIRHSADTQKQYWK